MYPERKRISAGATGTPTSLLDLRYFSGTNTPAYDEVGNIKSILDATNFNQKQCFGYDGLPVVRQVTCLVQTKSQSEWLKANTGGKIHCRYKGVLAIAGNDSNNTSEGYTLLFRLLVGERNNPNVRAGQGIPQRRLEPNLK